MTRVYDPQYPRPLVTPQAVDESDPHAELSAGEWREATREEQTNT